jgi:hypothetical protein
VLPPATVRVNTIAEGRPVATIDLLAMGVEVGFILADGPKRGGSGYCCPDGTTGTPSPYQHYDHVLSSVRGYEITDTEEGG